MKSFDPKTSFDVVLRYYPAFQRHLEFLNYYVAPESARNWPVTRRFLHFLGFDGPSRPQRKTILFSTLYQLSAGVHFIPVTCRSSFAVRLEPGAIRLSRGRFMIRSSKREDSRYSVGSLPLFAGIDSRGGMYIQSNMTPRLIEPKKSLN